MKVVIGVLLISFAANVFAEEYKSGRLEVKAFINEHANFYNNFHVKYIGGAPPEIVLVKVDDTEERVDVAEMKTDEICKLLEDKGFEKREVPPPPSIDDEL